MSGRLVLILSPERSGSTLLSVMLGAHGQVLAPPELHLMRFPDFAAWRRGYPAALASLCALLEMLGLSGDPASVESRYGGWTSAAIYEDLLRRVGPGRLLVDKTPGNAHQRAPLVRAESFAPAYVWLVRHPLAVTASRLERMQEKRRGRAGWLPRLKLPLFALRASWRRAAGSDVAACLAHWRTVHGCIRDFLADVPADRRTVLFYEDLVREPARAIDDLCARLGLAAEPAMLDPAAHLPPNLGWGIGDEKIRAHRRIDPASADRWREHYHEDRLDPDTRALWEQLQTLRTGHTGAL